MKVSLINLNLVAEDAIGTCIINQAQFFRRRGDDVHVYVLHPPHNAPADIETVTSVVTLGELVQGQQEHFRLSDLYIYHYSGHYSLMESIRGIDRGTVIFDYHNVTPPELRGSDAGHESLEQSIKGKALAHYADFCIADSPLGKQDLIDHLGYATDRVYVLTLVERGLEQYEAKLTEIVDQTVTYTLPEIPPELLTEENEEPQPTSVFSRDERILDALTDEIQAESDVAIRGYVIRSGIPLVGPLIAWVRRNLTSHLREPYLDPMIERQVALNRKVAEWIGRAISIWTTAARHQTELESRVKDLEAQIEALTRDLNENELAENR